MIVDKTKLGISFFDDTFGGVYRNKPVLCSGRHGSGKSLFACHFLNQALRDGEKALLLTHHLRRDIVDVAESIGLPFEQAVADGRLSILEYATFMPEKTASPNVMLPPQAFMDLQETVEAQSIRRLAFDTVLPWVAIHPISRIAEHVYSFVHAIARLGVTSLMTIPKPVSNPAFTLTSRLVDLCPISVVLDHSNGEHRTLRVKKFLGEILNLSMPFPFAIIPSRGLTGVPAARLRRNSVSFEPTASPADHESTIGNETSIIRFPE